MLRLRDYLSNTELGKRCAENLVIGSWNIRAFDSEKSPRLDESYHYIAEVIDHFDICAIQEVKRDLAPLERIRKLLGPDWEYFVTDVTGGGLGNSERQAFFYNTKKVIFRRQVGEVVLAPDELINGKRQFARTPFFASFQAGWFKFTLMSVHIVFAGTTLKDKNERAEEVRTLAGIAAKRAKRNDQVYVMIGDMNIEKVDDPIFEGLSANKLKTPMFGPTNLKGTKAYDQIAFTTRPDKTEFVNHGVIDWREAVFRPDNAGDFKEYKKIAQAVRKKEKKDPFKDWDKAYQTHFMSFEMSDHLPIWVEIKTDFSNDYLKRFI